MYEIPSSPGPFVCEATGKTWPTDSALERSFGRYLNSQGEEWVRPPAYRWGRVQYSPDWWQTSRAGVDVFYESKPVGYLAECHDKLPDLLRRMPVVRRYVPAAVLVVVEWAEGWEWPQTWRIENLGRFWEWVSPNGERAPWIGEQ